MTTRRDVWRGAGALAALAVLPGTGLAASPVIVRVPIGFARNGMPLLRLTLDGKGPYRFAIDTGAFAPCIRESLAKDLRLRRGGSIRTASLKGDEADYIYAAENVVIGGGLPFPKMSFIGFEKFPSSDMDGVLPASFLTSLPSQLDYEKREIRYYLNGADMDLDGFVRADAFFQAQKDNYAEKVFLTFQLDGRRLVCIVDTGAMAAIAVSGAYVGAHHLWDKYKVLRESDSVGANGQSVHTRIVVAPDLTLGSLHLNAAPVTLIDPHAWDSLGEEDVDGLVGTPLLRKFTLAFTGHKELYLKPNAGFAQISGRMPDQAVPDDAPAGAIPILYGEQHRILVPAKLGDDPAFPFMLATGQSECAISSREAEAHHIPALPDGGYDGGGLGFGEVRLPHLKLTAHGGPAALGLDFLRGAPVSLDFDADLLTFHTDAPPDMSGYNRSDAARQPNPRGGEGLYGTARLFGADLRCRIDTAFPYGLYLPPHTVAARQFWDRFPKARDAVMASAGRKFATREVLAGPFSLAGFDVRPAPLILADPKAAGAPDDDAVLGMAVLQRFNFVFDRDGAVWLRPNARFKA